MVNLSHQEAQAALEQREHSRQHLQRGAGVSPGTISNAGKPFYQPHSGTGSSTSCHLIRLCTCLPN